MRVLGCSPAERITADLAAVPTLLQIVVSTLARGEAAGLKPMLTLIGADSSGLR